MSFWTTLISVIDLLGCTVLLPGGSKVRKNLLFFAICPNFFSQQRILDMLFYETSATDGKKTSYPFFSRFGHFFCYFYPSIMRQVKNIYLSISFQFSGTLKHISKFVRCSLDFCVNFSKCVFFYTLYYIRLLDVLNELHRLITLTNYVHNYTAIYTLQSFIKWSRVYFSLP